MIRFLRRQVTMWRVRAVMPDVDTYLAKLSTLTGMSTQDWQDFMSLPPDAQAVVVQGYKDMSWVKNTFNDVLAVLAIIGTIAGVVSGVAGAVSAVNALKSL